MIRRLAAVVVFFVVSCVSTLALAAPRNVAQEAAIDEAVSAVDPALVDLVHQGNVAMDRNDAPAAVRAYGVVREKAPEVAAIARRLCTAEMRAGDPQAAIAQCRAAVAKQPDSAENHAALALAVLALPETSLDDIREAREAADAAEAIAPDTELAQSTTCAVALHVGDRTTLAICSAKLTKLAPTSPNAHLYAAIVLSNDDDLEGARRELDFARSTGLDASAYETIRAQLDRKPPPTSTREKIATAIVRATPVTLGAWTAIVFVLLVLGMLLSDAAGGEREPSRPTRALYRLVVLVAIAMFYVSAALGVIVLVLAVAVVALLFLSLVGATLPVEIAFALFGAYLLVAMVRALFERVAPAELGAPASKKGALRTTLDALTKRLKMDPIDEVYVVPGATLEVRELGGVLGHLRGKNKRALVVGAFALDGLGTRELGALVTTELLRYRGEGGAGGDVAIIERTALDALAERMQARGVATIANPAWWLVSLYRQFFERITEGAVDHQERMADARAAKVYGSESLIAGLRHVAKRGVEIEARAAAVLHDAFDGEEPPDVYARDPEADLRAVIDASLADLAERQEHITALKEDGYDEEDEAQAWSLFADREAIERAMNERLRAAMRDQIGLAGDQPASSASTVARA